MNFFSLGTTLLGCFLLKKALICSDCTTNNSLFSLHSLDPQPFISFNFEGLKQIWVNLWPLSGRILLTPVSWGALYFYFLAFLKYNLHTINSPALKYKIPWSGSLSLTRVKWAFPHWFFQDMPWSAVQFPSSFPASHCCSREDREHKCPEEERLLGQNRPGLGGGLLPGVIRLLNLINK